MSLPTDAAAVLAFWFEGDQQEIYRTKWFPPAGSEIQAQTDKRITETFGPLLAAAERRELHAEWCASRDAFVALIVLLDQFSRHVYRHDAGKRAGNDVLALALAEAFVAAGHHETVPTNYFVFALMPFRHTPTHARLASVLEHINRREVDLKSEYGPSLARVGDALGAHRHSVQVSSNDRAAPSALAPSVDGMRDQRRRRGRV